MGKKQERVKWWKMFERNEEVASERRQQSYFDREGEREREGEKTENYLFTHADDNSNERVDLFPSPLLANVYRMFSELFPDSFPDFLDWLLFQTFLKFPDNLQRN